MHPVEDRPLRITLVLWGGSIGGAEVFTADLAKAMRALGAEPHVLFVLEAAEIGEYLDGVAIPHSSLDFRRGRSVLRAPRLLARTVSATNPDLAVLTATGYLAAALRSGGFRKPIIGVEHGSVLQLPQMPPLKRWAHRADRLSGLRACSAVVAVSEYVKERLELIQLRRRVVCIENGVDLQRFSPAESPSAATANGPAVIGSGSRLVKGKGVSDAIEMLTHPALQNANLRIAGEGPELEALKALALSRGVDGRVDFLGPVTDMPAFWRSVDVGVVPSNEWVESFGMVAIEAMACGKPVVVSNNGGLPEVIADGETGRVAQAGNVVALAEAMGDYVRDRDLRIEHGHNARRRCEEQFGIERTASRYLDLCADVVEAAWSRGSERRTP